LKEEKTKIDANFNFSGAAEVLVDKELGPYDLMMVKVDVRKGGWSMNLFYKMQIVHELNRNVFVVCTRWGRIGESG